MLRVLRHEAQSYECLSAVELQMLLNKTTSIAYIDPAPYVAVFIPGAAFLIP